MKQISFVVYGLNSLSQGGNDIDLFDKVELQRALRTLEEGIEKCTELTANLLKKCSILDEITNYIDSYLIRSNDTELDVFKLHDMIISVSETLKNSSRNELEVKNYENHSINRCVISQESEIAIMSEKAWSVFI